MEELEFRDALTRAWLACWVKEMERPDWFDWFGFYPAKASVNAAKARLRAMDANLVITQVNAMQIFDT